MTKAHVNGSRENIIQCAKLLDVPQPLKLRCVNKFPAIILFINLNLTDTPEAPSIHVSCLEHIVVLYTYPFNKTLCSLSLKLGSTDGRHLIFL